MPWRTPSGTTRARKLTEQSVSEIRHRWAAGGVEQRQLAAEYGVSASVVGMIVRGGIWQQAPGPITPARHRSGVPHIKNRLPAEMGPCSGCDRVMIRVRDYREDPQAWQERGCVKNSGKGRCISCAADARRGGQGRVEPYAVGARRPVVRKACEATPPAEQQVRRPVVREVKRVPKAARPLPPDELARLRRLVGLPAVLPSERAS